MGICINAHRIADDDFDAIELESGDLLYPVKKDADGNRLCRWCRKPVGKRRSYCGKPCLKEVDIRCSAGMLRHHTKERDKGVCAECGLDTSKLKRIMDHAARSYYEIRHGIGTTDHMWFSGEFSKDSFLVRLGFNRHGSLWEADHILEVSNGGESTLENTATLCVPCHKAKTKRMHAERKEARTGIAPRPPIQEVQLRML